MGLISKFSHLKANLLHHRSQNVAMYSWVANNVDMITKDSLVLKNIIKRVSKFRRWGILAIVMVTVCDTRVEKAPDSGCYHVVGRFPEKQTEEDVQAAVMAFAEGGGILSSKHHQSIQVVSVVRKIIQAMHTGLGLNQNCTIKGYSPKDSISDQSKEVVVKVGEKSDNTFVKGFGKRCSIKHLEGQEWRVMVVETPKTDNAALLTEGSRSTIIVLKPSLDQAKEDELACSIAHEVGHAVAKHTEVREQREFLVIILGIILSCLNSRAHLLVRLALYPLVGVGTFHLAQPVLIHLHRRDELEADFIGMMLMASAGYDPRTAQKYIRSKTPCPHGGVCPTHPSGIERVKSMEEQMGKAMAVYEEMNNAG